MNVLPSLSFSGAGFLGAYHVGVAMKLIQHSLIQKQTKLIGASAGSIICVALALKIPMDEAAVMITEIAQETHAKSMWRLDALTPGFSLLDALNPKLRKIAQEKYDLDSFPKNNSCGCIFDGRVSIALADRNLWGKIGDKNALRIAKKFSTLDDAIGAVLLSSFVPYVTSATNGKAVKWAEKVVNGQDLWKQSKEGIWEREIGHGKYWDGGLSDNWPTYDKDTVIVSCLKGDFSPNKYICKNGGEGTMENNAAKQLRLSKSVAIDVCGENLTNLRQMLLSSDDQAYNEVISMGNDDALKFIKANNLENIKTVGYERK